MMEPDSHFNWAVSENVQLWAERLEIPQLSSPEIVRELPNMLQAVHYGLALPATRPEALRLLARMHRSVERAGRWQEWLTLCELALQLGVAEDWPTQVRLLNGRGVLRRHSDQLGPALEDHQLAGKLAGEHKDDLLWAQAQYHCALDYARQNAVTEAENHALAALSCFVEQASGSIWHAATLNCLGDIARIRGDYERAVTLLSQAVYYFELLGDGTDLARALNNLALAWQGQSRWPDAARCYEAALQALEDGSDATTKSLLRSNYGILFYEQEDYRRAELIFREADTLALRETGNVFLRASIAQNIGSALLKQGSYVEAEWHLNRAAILWQQSNNNLSLGNTLGTLAELHARTGRQATALDEYEQALRLLAAYPHHHWAQQLVAEFEAGRQAVEAGRPAF